MASVHNISPTDSEWILTSQKSWDVKSVKARLRTQENIYSVCVLKTIWTPSYEWNVTDGFMKDVIETYVTYQDNQQLILHRISRSYRNMEMVGLVGER